MMNFAMRLQQYFGVPTNLYIMGISLLGIIILIQNYQFRVLTYSEWVLLLSIAGSIALLNKFTFRLPPTGSSQSMDSTIYLACIFTFGLEITLDVLLLSSLIYMSYKRNMVWWRPLLYFFSDVFMITGAYYVFILTGGQVGLINTNQIYTYFLSMTIAFIVNVLVISLYHFLSVKSNFFHVTQGILKINSAPYICTLLFSLLLSLTFEKYFYLSLFLFVIVAVLLSVSSKKMFELYEDVSNKATRDQHTGLYNQGYFEKLLEEELSRARALDEPISLATMDVDGFKKYNDTFGHLKGDELLELFGKLLTNTCEPNNYIVARQGGDEFAILMPGLSERGAFSFINTIKKKANDSNIEGGEVLPHRCLSFSAGIVACKGGIHDKSQLMDKADQAMYFAKAQGKNLVHIYNEQSLSQLSIDIEQEILEIEQQLKIFLSKDIYTFQHSKRVFSYAMDLCDYISLSDEEKKELILGALFHDIGKLEVPRYILQKKEELSFEEWEILKKHVGWGKDIVSAFGKYDSLLPMIELHHERVDGKGYPYGLQGNEIPKLARILCIINSFDAMTTERFYQKSRTFEEAITELRLCSGHQFDPIYVESFIQMIYAKYEFKLESLSYS